MAQAPDRLAAFALGTSRQAGKSAALHGADPRFGEEVLEFVVERLGSDPDMALRTAKRFQRYSTNPVQSCSRLRMGGILLRARGAWHESAEAFLSAAQAARNATIRDACSTAAIDSLGRAGRHNKAEELARATWARLGRRNDRLARARVAINAGNSELWADRYSSAKFWFRRALGNAFDAPPYVRASIDLGLSTGELFSGSLSEAKRLAGSAEAALLALGLTGYAAIARSNLGHALLMEGRYDEAMDVFLSCRIAEASEEARVRNEEFLGDAHFNLQCFPEALDAYRAALAQSSFATRMNTAHCRMGAGDCLWMMGHSQRAIDEWRLAARGYRRAQNRVWAAWSELKQVRALPASRRRRNLADKAIAAFTAGNNSFFLACALMERAACCTQPDESKPLLRAADRLIRRHGYRGLNWKLEWLHARSEGKSIERYRCMFSSIVRDRVLMRSSIASTRFYDDKIVAIGEFLFELLKSPRRRRLDEALQVLATVRSAALIDEIRTTNPLLADWPEFEALRAELGSSSQDGSQPFRERRIAATGRGAVRLERRWIELDRVAIAPTLGTTTFDENILVWARSNGRFLGLTRRIHRFLDSSESEIESKLRWLQFELLQPQIDRTADPACVLEALIELKSILWDPFVREEPIRSVSPDGALWMAPWHLFAALDGHEVMISPMPGKSVPDRVGRMEKVAIWSFDSPGLPSIGHETEAFLRAFPNAVVCDSIDAARRILQRQDLDLLHVASHASFHRSNPMFGALHCGDKRLLAAEIARSGFRTRLAVLSACETGFGSGTKRAEIEGLTRAFLACGAQQVVATQWMLDDESASIFMQALYRNLTKNDILVNAISLARSAVREKFAHPYFWGAVAPFRGYTW